MYKNSHRLSIICIVVIGITILFSLIASLKFFANREQEIIMSEEIVRYRAKFDLNGATSIDNNMSTCSKEETGCFITFPKARRYNGVVLGYSDNANTHEVKYHVGDTISIEGDTTFYVISKEKISNVTIYNEYDYITNEDISCDIYNNEKSCYATLPLFSVTGYENRGYSTTKGSRVGFVFPNEQYEINKNKHVMLYPIYGTVSRGESINVSKTYNLKHSLIEIENGCDESIYNSFLKYIEEIEEKTPFLLIGSKISFLNEESFDRIWGANYVGMNFGPRNLRSLDLRCSTRFFNDYYATMIHEMTHSWDFYYATRVDGGNISSKSDITNLYNKYINKQNRPFRNYSYTSIYEFFADMMRYYYFKYIVPSPEFKDLSYPSDIKKTMEKYICIAKNDYDIERCS